MRTPLRHEQTLETRKLGVPSLRFSLEGRTAMASTSSPAPAVAPADQMATDAFLSPTEGQFKRVVLIEWPRAGMMAMGLVTGRTVAPRDQRPMLVVYVPTVPNPTSGNLAFVYEDEVVETDMHVEDAMKIVFSGGMVLAGLSNNGNSKEQILSPVS